MQTSTVNTKTPATRDVTGGFSLRVEIISRCRANDFAQPLGALDAPEWMPAGATCQWGALLVLRDFC